MAALGLLFVFGLLFCAPIVAGRVPVASDTYGLWSPWSQLSHDAVNNLSVTDSAYQALPWAVFERKALAEGEWPMWDPYSFSGYSYAANGQSQLYYPLTWLLWFLPLSGMFQARALFNLALAGWGMYAFCRVLGTGRVGAVIGGMAFMGSGMSQTAVDAPFISSVYGWLPIMLAATDRALRERGLRWTAVAALVCGLQAVAGNPQWVVYAYFATACWIGWRGVQLWLARPGSALANVKVLTASAARGTLGLMGGGALAAIHLAPFFEMLGLSNRAGVRVSSNSDPPAYLLRLLMPSFFGNPVDIKGYPLGSSDLWYVGIPTLVLGTLAAGAWAFDIRKRRWSRSYLALAPEASTPFWAGVALVSVLVAYGVGPFLYARWLPGFNSTLPVRIGYLFIAAVSVLAALGWDRLSSHMAEEEQLRAAGRRMIGVVSATVVLAVPVGVDAWLWADGNAWKSQANADSLRKLQESELLRAGILLIVSLLAFIGIALVSTRSRAADTPGIPGGLKRALCGLVICIVGADLVTMMPGYTTFVPPASMIPNAPSEDWLAKQPGVWRMMGVDNPVPSFVPDTHLLFGLLTVAGYDSLHPRSYDEFWGAAQPDLRPDRQLGPYSNVFVRPQVYTATLADLLNVKYVAAAGDLHVTAGFTKVYSGEISIYENRDALPRAFLVPQAGTRMVTQEEALARLAASDFDPMREVLIEKGQPRLAPFAGQQEQGQAQAQPGSASFMNYGRNRVELDVNASARAWLVLADSNYPGWSVTVDGRAAPLYTVDHILRGVQVEAGKHTVVFSFLPSGFVVAGLVSVSALLLVLVGIVLGGWRP